MLNQSLFKKPNIPLEGGETALQRDKWIKCVNCKKLIDDQDLQDYLQVCPRCGHHFRLTGRQRLGLLCDENSFTELDGEFRSKNPLNFPGYEDKLAGAQKSSGEGEAVICGQAQIGGVPCAVFVMDASFMMGSMGTVVGDKITRLFELATDSGLPVVGCTVSGGARMQEGILSLMQMAKISGAVSLHSQAGLFYLVVLTDPTTGGVTASFAMEGDVIISEPGALIGFAGPRVIEQTIRKKLPEGFQRAELLLEKGFVDAIVTRHELKGAVTYLLKIHTEVDTHACL